LLIVALIMSAATLLTLSPTLNEQFNKLIEMSVLACLLAYIYACASVWRYPDAATAAVHRWLSLGAIALCGWVIAMSSATMLVLGAGALALLSVVFWFTRQRTAS
jgi:amino acid transporter